MEDQLRAGHPDAEGLCRALIDWSAELRLLQASQAVAPLQQGTLAAATTLLKTMSDPSTPASVKVRAAEAIFNHAAKAVEIGDVEARVAELERAADASKGTPDEAKPAAAHRGT